MDRLPHFVMHARGTGDGEQAGGDEQIRVTQISCVAPRIPHHIAFIEEKRAALC